ncbi:MAG TPA: hypothetical protein VIO82_00200 [Candidatus Methylopumilus sp.]|jgi:hypothetical protein
MNDKKDISQKVKDAASEATIKALTPSEQFPCKPDDKACTKRWLEAQSDCA